MRVISRKLASKNYRRIEHKNPNLPSGEFCSIDDGKQIEFFVQFDGREYAFILDRIEAIELKATLMGSLKIGKRIV